MADSKTTALSELSVPSLTDLLYTIDDPAGTPVSNKLTTTRALGLMGLIPGGRLTLTTATPVTTSDVTAAGTLYYTPYLHNVIRVWDGTRWLIKNFAEISLALTLTADKNYDVFVDDDAATLSLSAAWTNDTTRADALGTQDSVAVLNSDKTKLWLGTIRASGANTTEDSEAKRFVSNAYNPIARSLNKSSASGHTYNSGTARSWNNDAANQVAFVTGSAITCTVAVAGDITPTVSGFPFVAAIPDWTSGTSGGSTLYSMAVGRLGAAGPPIPMKFGIGYHYVRAIEAELAAQVSTFDTVGIHVTALL